MAQVVPWPAPGELGVINLHWFGEFKNGKRFFTGKPFVTPEALVDYAMWATKHPERGYRDMYFCLSQQSTVQTAKDGKRLKAVRSKDCVVSLKSVWLDIDVKPGAYSTTQEAMDALVGFCDTSDIPRPGAIVRSGSGGLHCYWISPTPIAPDLWHIRADKLCSAAKGFGLKFDPQCTVNPVQVLRVPGTKNFKKDPPKGVSLAFLEDAPDVKPL